MPTKQGRPNTTIAMKRTTVSIQNKNANPSQWMLLILALMAAAVMLT